MASEVEQAVAYFERLHQVLVTVHDYDGRLRGQVGQERLVHRHRLCMAAKGTAERLCLAEDTERVRHVLPYADGGILRRCHAGVTEAVFGCRREGRLAWVLFAGPLQSRHGDGADVLEGLWQLAARLRLWEDSHPTWPQAARVEQGGRGAPPDRAGQIHRWIQVHHREEATLDGLAAALGLSRFQASRVVRTATGYGFAALLLEARLTTARALLRETDLDVMDIAIRSGFNDRSHFHRAFKKVMDVSPLTWRRQEFPESP